MFSIFVISDIFGNNYIFSTQKYCLFVCNEVCYPLMSLGDRRQRVNIWYSVRTTDAYSPDWVYSLIIYAVHE